MPARWSGTGLPNLVGRRDELATLEDAWSAVVGGRRQVVFIGGEPGAGKTRLLAEAAVRLHDEGAAVLLGSVREGVRPAVPALRRAGLRAARRGRCGELTAATGHSDRPGALLDRLATIAGKRRARSPDEGAGAEYQRELYDAVVHAVTAAAADGPVVLALEDLQWAGATALSLLTHLVERTSEEQLLVVATHRTTVPDRSAPLVHTVAQLYRLDGVRRLDLAGLGTDDIARYLVEETGVPERRVRTAAAVLRDQTGGNPFFLREMWRDLAARGGLPALRSEGFTAPESVRDTLQSRLDRLAEPHRQVLELAAVIGEELELATLLAAGEWTAGTTLAAVDEAVSHGLLEPSGADGSHFRFPHALARTAALDHMTPSRRVQEHARVAKALEDAPGEPAVQRLAHHYASARALGHSEKALHYLLEAGRLADASLAHEEAARCFEQAADLTDDAAQRDLHRLAAARSHLLGGNFARARDVYEQVWRQSGPRHAVQAAIGYEAASWRPGLPGHRAVELLTVALGTIEHDETDPVYIRGARQPRTRDRLHRCDRRGHSRRRSRDRAGPPPGGRPAARRHAAGQPVARPAPAGRPGQARASHRALRLADRTGDLGQLGPAAYFRGVIAYMSGDPVGWDAAHHDLLRTARVTGQGFFAYMGGCLDYGRQFGVGTARRGRAHLRRPADDGRVLRHRRHRGPLRRADVHGAPRDRPSRPGAAPGQRRREPDRALGSRPARPLHRAGHAAPGRALDAVAARRGPAPLRVLGAVAGRPGVPGRGGAVAGRPGRGAAPASDARRLRRAQPGRRAVRRGLRQRGPATSGRSTRCSGMATRRSGSPRRGDGLADGRQRAPGAHARRLRPLTSSARGQGRSAYASWSPGRGRWRSPSA